MKKRFIPLLVLLVIFSTSSLAKRVSAANRSTPAPTKATTTNQDLETVPGEPGGQSVNLCVYMPQLFVGYLGGVWDIALSNVMSFGPIVRVFVFGKYSSRGRLCISFLL